ncbi:anti-sigma factor domain-containing protein [Streptomyces sp. NPDC102364]|uniref:anti-sigma factor n=1 Tax=Streptomyces sp. NPDC102364 TaxID=3366161 RepID=UPI0037FA3ABE
MSAADLHTLTGAYALHALTEAEREEFERHLGPCESCAQEVAELSATANRLGLGLSMVPPAGFRDQVLQRITTVRQEAPRTSPDAPKARLSWRARRVPRWTLAACLAGVVALGGTTVWQYQEAQDAQQRARTAQAGTDEVAAVLAAPDAKVRTASLDGGANGTVVVSGQQDKAVFVASGMTAPPHGKVYQLWFDDGGTMRSAGLMDPGRESQTVLMAGAVGDSTGMGITVEPSGGSDRPTSKPLALMSLPT